MAKRRWSGTCSRWVAAAAIGIAVLSGAPAVAWGQGAKPDAVALKEADRLNGAVVRLYGEGEFDAAIPLAARLLAIRENALGPDHPDVAQPLNNLAALYYAKRDYARAEPLFQRALAIWEKALGPDHPDVATSLNNLAALSREKGDYTRAEPLFQRALAIREKTLGPDHPDVAQPLNNLAALYYANGDYARAEPLYKRVLAIREKALGPDHPAVATSLNNLAELYRGKGDFARAEPLYKRALDIGEKALGSDHPAVATSLNNLAELYRAKGDYTRADPLYQRALAISEKTLGPDHPDVATLLNNLAGLYDAKGEYARAELLYQRALAISEKALGSDHRNVAASLINLAGLYDAKGHFARAEPLHQRALAILEKALGPDHPDVGRSLINLAGLYLAKGEYARAEALHQRALTIMEKALAPDHPDVAQSLNCLAVLYDNKRDYVRAEPLHQRALAVREKALGPDHPDVAQSLDNLAWLYREQGDYTRAEPLYQRALAILEKALGPDHPDVASSLNHLAELYRAKGDYTRAALLYQRALAIREKTLGPDHPDLADSLSSLAGMHLARNDTQAAIQRMTQAAAIEDRNITRELAVGSDEQRRAYMVALHRGGTTDVAISLHLQEAPKAQNAERLAITTILNRKGRVLDAMGYSFGGLRIRLAPPNQALFYQWRSLTAQYSALAVRGPGAAPIDQYRRGLKDLDDQRQEAENKLSFRSTKLQAALRPVTVDQVAAAIPQGAALVELFRYEPFNAKSASLKDRWGEPRYVAYVLRRGGEIAWADLGEALPIEAAVNELLPTLRRAAADPKAAARKLDALVMQPIHRLLGDTRWVLLSPDDVLNLVPFGALIDENGHYLVERYSFTYLASGRDLLRMRVAAPSKGNAVVIGAPHFGDARAAVPLAATHPDTTGNGNERSADMNTRDFGPLPFAAEEARALQTRIGNATLLLGPNATEAAVKALHGPPILHMATHGFFLKDQAPIEVPLPDRGGLRASAEFAHGLRYAENALLRSGLAFAGANARQSGNDDGILTALEASQLDLYGTKLVVMSACETGIGKTESGDGVYGLRRALTIAGAETQVMSLWKVDDAATRALMEAYYDGLLQGGGRSEALRQVQLAMLHTPERAHPYYWASFIVSGNPAALDGKPVPPDFAKVQPGMRGCGCEVGSHARIHEGTWAALLFLLALARIRRSGHPLAGRCTKPPHRG